MAQDVNGLIQMSRGLFIIHKTISDTLLSGSGILGWFCWVPLTLCRLQSKYWPEQWSPPGSVWGEATSKLTQYAVSMSQRHQFLATWASPQRVLHDVEAGVFS